MRWLYDLTDSMDMNLSKLQEIVKDREAWCAAVPGIKKSWTWLTAKQQQWNKYRNLKEKTKI